MVFLSIIRKNIKVLLKSKGTALMVILGPLLVMFLVGLAFDNSNAYRINIGVYSPDYSNLTLSFIKKLESPFRVVKYPSQSSCVDAIKEGDVNTCIVFPRGFNISDEEHNTVRFFVDYSKINLVWVVRDVVFSRLSERSEEITKDLTNMLLKKIENIESEVKGKRTLIVELTTSNNRIGESVRVVNENFASMNLSFDPDSFGVNNLDYKISELSSNAKSAVSKAKTTLLSLKSSIEASSLNSTEQEDLIDEINSTLSDLSSIESTINSLYDGSSKDIDLLLDDLSTKISELNNRFDKIRSLVADSKKELSSINQELVSSLGVIVELQGSFDKILGEINSISIREASKIAKPVNIEIKPLSYQKTHLSFMFPTLLLIVIMFAGLMLGSTIIILEKNSKALFRNLISPVTPTVFTITSFLSVLLLTIPQLLIMFGVSLVFLKKDLLSNLPNALLITTLGLFLFTILGMVIGYLLRTEEATILAVLSLSTIMLFLSNTLLPLESMPELVVKVASYNPFVLLNFSLNRVLIFSFPIQKLTRPLLILLGYTVLLFLLSLLINKTNLNKPRKEKAKEIARKKRKARKTARKVVRKVDKREKVEDKARGNNTSNNKVKHNNTKHKDDGKEHKKEYKDDLDIVWDD